MIVSSPTQRAVLGKRPGASAYFLGGYDPSAAAFFAKGVSLGEAPLSTPIKNAVNDLIVSQKSNDLWTRQVAQYLFVGETPVWHSLNVKDPETFQITWHGAVTHDANGPSGDGSTGYGDTGVNVNTLTLSNVAYFSYNRSANPAAGGCALGAFSGVQGILAFDYSSGAPGTVTGDVNNLGDGRMTALSFYDKLIVATRRSLSDAELYRDGVSLVTDALTVTATSFNSTMLVLARNLATGSPTSFLNGGISFSGISTGLTDTEVNNLNTIVNTFQTALGRQV